MPLASLFITPCSSNSDSILLISLSELMSRKSDTKKTFSSSIFSILNLKFLRFMTLLITLQKSPLP